MKIKSQHPCDTMTRAPAGGIIGLNGIHYDGGEFLPMSARGGNRGTAAREQLAKREASKVDALAIAKAEGVRLVAKETARRAILKDLIAVIMREAETETRSNGFWHNTAATLHLFYREWKQWDGVSYDLMDRSWQTGKLSEKWANRIARTDAEYEALIADA